MDKGRLEAPVRLLSPANWDSFWPWARPFVARSEHRTFLSCALQKQQANNVQKGQNSTETLQQRNLLFAMNQDPVT